MMKDTQPYRPTEVSYRELSSQLEAALTKLQSSELDVDEAADLYEVALGLIAKLEAHLTMAKNRVSKVQANFSL